MASKSKKRRRVLGASCILAALIIAGSSFAWFTSSDEVTNRLSANADYDVRIVESFAPPKNFLPGQEVNKDVYAVNTGTIGAFVKETVSGVMTITRETKVPSADFSTEKANLTKLTAAERYVMEAGSYLALKPATAITLELGDKIVSMIPNGTDLDKYTTADVLTDFAPTENGLYVFRRSIKVADDTDKTETFEYEGYYYEDGDFYKVELESVTPDKLPDNAGDTNHADGNLTDATYSLFKDVTTREVPTLTYDATGHKLVATVPSSGLSVADAQAALTAAGGAYDTAAHNYQEALAKQTKAVSEDNSKSAAEKAALTALNNAKADEAASKLAYDLKLAEYTNKKALYDTAAGNLSTATSNKENAQKALYGNSTNTPTSLPSITDPDNPDSTEVNALDAGLYKTMMQKLVAKKSALADQEAFRQELLAYANNTGSGGLNKGWPANSTIDYMVKNLTAAELAAFSATEQHTQYKADAEYIVAKKNYDDKVADYNSYEAQETALTSETGTLKSEYEAALVALYGTGTTSMPNPLPSASDQTEVSALNNGLYKTWKQAVLDTATAQASYDAAVIASGTASTAHDTADENVAQTKAALDAAKKAFDDAKAALTGTGDIKINIKLANDVTAGGTAEKWQILPTTVAGNEAVFYLTNILEGGETSVQLIDSVTLDSSVTQDMYKYFDFDLNVKLDSAQVAYEADNKTIKTEPATTELHKTPTLNDPTDIDTGINWT